jgi:hypothetical protein
VRDFLSGAFNAAPLVAAAFEANTDPLFPNADHPKVH